MSAVNVNIYSICDMVGNNEFNNSLFGINPGIAILSQVQYLALNFF